MHSVWHNALSVIAIVLFIGAVALSVAEPVHAPSINFPTLVSSTTAPTTTAVSSTTPTIAIEEPAPPIEVKPVEIKPTPVPTPPPKVVPPLSLGEAIQTITDLAVQQPTSTQSVNERTRAALVNIICTTDSAGSFESISGSGVIIDPRGVILTNAHVAQFFLLKDYPRDDFVDCVIRTGSPARNAYTAKLMFLPPSWISNNAKKIVQETPTGTGERDYALLKITGSVGSVTLPSQFPFLLTSLLPPDKGDTVLQAGYAAGFLGGITVQNDLYATSAYTTVRDVYTFDANTADLFALGGTIVAQQGSSGGPVVNEEGILMGIIVTSTSADDTASRVLRALAASYIVRDFELERGKSLQSVLASDLNAEVAIFESIFAPSERTTLIDAIENR